MEGQVLTSDGPLPGVEIFLEKENLPKNKSYSASNSNGYYTFQINSFENEQIFLRFEKRGYSTKKVELFPNSKKLRQHLSPIILESEMQMTSISKEISSN